MISRYIFIAFLSMATFVEAGRYVDSRPDLQVPSMQRAVHAKQAYRDAWMMDNVPELSAIAQIDYAKDHTPDFDQDTKAVIERGSALLKTINFGVKGTDITQKSAEIRANPKDAISDLNKSMKTSATPLDAFEAADIIEPVKRLNEKINNDKSLQRSGYRININDF